MIKFKRGELIVICIFVFLFILFFIPSMFQTRYTYPLDNYEGIQLPTKLVVVKDDKIFNTIYDVFIFKKDNLGTIGTYRGLTKTISIANERQPEEIKNTLRHEIAHYKYHNNLTNIQKKIIEGKYKSACDNVKEYYAYTIEYYGKFNYT